MALTGKKRAKRQIQYSTRFSAYTGKIRNSVPGDPFYDYTTDLAACPLATSIIYISAATSANYVTQCPRSKEIASTVLITVPINAHESIIDQATADAAAVAELGIVGQYKADTTGTCAVDSGWITRAGSVALDNNSFDVTVVFEKPIGVALPVQEILEIEVFMKVKTTGNIFVNITRWVQVNNGSYNFTFTESVPSIIDVTIVLGNYIYPIPTNVNITPLVIS
jgi:hypothetical protein